MKNFLFLFALFAPTLLVSQNYWTSHDINKTVNDLYIESPQKVWLSTSNGLCVFNTITSQQTTCYDSSNSNLTGIPSQLIYANNRIWVTTSLGISSFNGTTFTNYTTANGLISNSITDLAVDTNGQLWLASLNGVSYFDGMNFIHDSLITARQIAIDDSNRVFAINHTVIMDYSIYGLIQVKVDTGWQVNTVTGITPFLNGGPAINYSDIKETGGKIVILGSSFDGGYYELSYPAHIDSVKLNWESSSGNFYIRDLTIDQNRRSWVTQNVSDLFIFSGVDSLLNSHHLNDVIFSNKKGLSVKGNMVCAFIGQKLFTSSISIEPNKKITEEIAVNSIRTNANILGPLFNNYMQGIADFEMPKGSNSYSIYNANFMISSKRNGDTTFRMNQLNGYNLNLKMGPVNSSAGLGGNWITNITKQDIQNHISNYTQVGYVLPDNIANWRGNGDVTIGMANKLADFIDINQNQIYEPMLGDYPAIKGDEAVYWINHTQKFEYHGMLYGFDNPTDSALNQSLFIDYEIINRDVVAYDSIKLGMVVDFDLGNPMDDAIGCDSLENVFFVYNGDAFDEDRNGVTGYGANIPVVGVKFLSDSMDGFVYYNIGSGNNGDPVNEENWFDYLNSRLLNGNPILYKNSSIPTKYMLTNNWRADTSGGIINIPGDRRGLGHIPYFGLQPGQSKTVSVAIGYGTKINGGNKGALPNLLKVLDSAKNFWDSTSIVLAILETKSKIESTNLSVYPNPSNGNFTIKLENNEIEKRKMPLQIYSSEGVLIKTIERVFSGEIISLEGQANGVYFVKLGTEVRRVLLMR
jgi:hypothetical protein